MAGPRLGQIANEAPAIIDVVTSGRVSRQAPCFSDWSPVQSHQVIQPDHQNDVDWDDWLDFPSNGEEDLDSHSNQDVVSIPGLTSDTSDEAGASPSSPARDFFPDNFRLRALRQHDDELTVPQREIRSKVPDYPHQIQILSNPGSSSSSLADGQGEKLTSNTSLSSQSSSKSSLSPVSFSTSASKPERGKRSGPLANAEDVAVVREHGACLRCKIKKIKCDALAVCESCVKEAKKFQMGGLALASQDICVRRRPSLFGPAFERTSPGCPKTGMMSATQQWRIYFDGCVFTEPLDVLVLEVQQPIPYGTHHNFKGLGRDYIFPRSYVPNAQEIMSWSEKNMLNNGYTDFQSALDRLTLLCAKSGPTLPQADLLSKVHQFRCMYKVWKEKPLCYRGFAQESPSPMPQSLLRELRGLARSSLSSLEGKILSSFDKLLKPGPLEESENFPIWICMMQLILTYSDVCEITTSRRPRFGFEYQQSGQDTRRHKLSIVARQLFVALSLMCKTHFEKSTLEDRARLIWQQKFGREIMAVQRSQKAFYDQIGQRSDLLNTYLKALFAEPCKLKPSKSSAGRQRKKQKTK